MTNSRVDREGLPGEQTRDRLLDAAQSAFAERGFAATGLRDVTETAGVAHGMIRHYFGTKLDLWRSVVDRATDRYRAELAPYAEQRPDETEVLEIVRGAGRRFLETSARHPDLLRLVLHESISGGQRLDYLLDRFAGVGSTMTQLFELAQRSGRLRQFDQRSFFLFLLMAGAMPFAVPALACGIVGHPFSPDSPGGRAHIARFLETAYGGQPASGGPTG